MFIVVTVLIMIAAILLALVVLIQNGKGGGLAANFASQNQVMGVRKTTDFLEKATWTLAIALVVLCLASSALMPNTRVKTNSLNNSNIPTVPTNNGNAQSGNTATPVK